MDPLTDPPTPPNQTPTHGWGIIHKFQIFKQNQNILIRSSFIAFLLIWGGKPWGVGVGVAHPMHMHTHTHMHTCTCMCIHTCMHDKHGCLHGGGHLQFPNMFFLAFCVCVCMHMHVHVSRDTPMPSDGPNPSAPSPEPQGAQITESS